MRRKGDLVLGMFLLLLGISRTQAGWIDGNIYFFALGIIAIVVGTIIIAKAIHSQKVAAEQERQAAAQKTASPQQAAPMSTELIFEQRAKARLARKHLPFPDDLDGMRKTYSYDAVKIFVPDDVNLLDFKLGNTLYAFKEPTNPYDDHAVMLSYCVTEKKLGYLYRGKLQAMANDYLSSPDGYVFGRIYDIDDLSRSVWIDLAFYRDETELDEEYDEEDE